LDFTFRRSETPNIQAWTLFRRSGIPIQSSELHFEADRCLELHFEADHCLEFHFEADQFKSRTLFRDGPIQSGIPFEVNQFKSETPLGADYNISKSGTPLKADYLWKKWTELFQKSGTLIRSGPSRRSRLQSRTRSRLKMDPILQRTRFASFWKLLEEFKVISFPDVYRTNFED
ncbi:hypothetical protein RclHR1_23100001, partial [Rhizophagus clarus]